MQRWLCHQQTKVVCEGEEVAAGRVLMYIENSRGTKTEPCRTPEPIGSYGELDCTIDSNCLDSVGMIALYPQTHLIAEIELNF